MKREFRSTPIQSVNLSDDSPNGVIEGACSIKGYLDDHGTIWLDACYANLDEFLKRGYMPDTHSIETKGVATMQTNIAMPVQCFERADDLFIRGEFHSKQRSQDVRSDAIERTEKGQYVGFSTGFRVLESFRIYPKDYPTELPKYLRSKYLDEGIRNAKKFPYVEVFKKVELEEVSVLLCQSHKDAVVTDVRSTMNKPNEQRAQYLGEYIEAGITISALSRVSDALMWNVFYDCAYNEDVPIEESVQTMSDAIDEYKAYCILILRSLRTLDQAIDGEESTTRLFAKNVRETFNNPDDQSPSQRFPQQLQRALSAVEDSYSRTKAIAKLRSESNMQLVVSPANHEKLSEIYTRGNMVMSKLGELLQSTNPNTTNELALQANALRSKILRGKLQPN